MSRSIPAGGQMTPFDWASLSLSGAELPPPTVGGSPLISGGHVAPPSGDGFPVACASATFAAATLRNVAMIRIVGRKGNSSRTCGACYSTHGRAKRSRDVVCQRLRSSLTPRSRRRAISASSDLRSGRAGPILMRGTRAQDDWRLERRAPGLPLSPVATRYTRVPSTFFEPSLSLRRLRTTPARKPRTECCCQPVACIMAAIVGPGGLVAGALAFPGRNAIYDGGYESRRFGRCAPPPGKGQASC